MAYRQIVLAACRLRLVLWSVLLLEFALPVRAEAQAPSVTDGKAGAVRDVLAPQLLNRPVA